MPSQRATVATVILLLALGRPLAAQEAVPEPDSADVQIRAVVRTFYLNLASQNWDALSKDVLSPKLLERRGGPGDLQMVTRDRTRGRGSPHATAGSAPCSSSSSPSVDDAAIRVDGDWAEVSVPRCSGSSSGMDEFRLLYFEKRWRFIYTDLFEAPQQTTP
jgi:hypothetical protein